MELLRLPRQTFTAAIIELCEDLDRHATGTVPWRGRHKGPRSAFRVRNVWLAGAYAIGAPTCGRLELIVEFDLPDVRREDLQRLVDATFVQSERCRFHLGPPGPAFGEAVRLWHGPDSCWRETLRALEVVPPGLYAVQEHAEPLLSARLDTDSDRSTVLGISQMCRDGEVCLDFVAPDNLSGDAPTPHRALVGADSPEPFLAALGPAARQVLPALAPLVHRLEPYGGWSKPTEAGVDVLKCGGTWVFIGHASLPVGLLDGSLAVRRIVLAPPMLPGDQPLAFTVERGPSHHDHLRLDGVTAFFLEHHGVPVLERSDCDRMGSGLQVPTLRLYRDPDVARRAARKRGRGVAVCRRQGAEILELTPLAHAVEVDGHFLPVTVEGRLAAARSWEGSVDDLVEALQPASDAEG